MAGSLLSCHRFNEIFFFVHQERYVTLNMLNSVTFDWIYNPYCDQSTWNIYNFHSKRIPVVL